MAGHITLTQSWIGTESKDSSIKFHPKGDALHKDQKTRERVIDTFATPTQAGAWLQNNGAQGSRYALWTPQGGVVPVKWDAHDRKVAAIRAAMVILYRQLGCSDEEARALAVLPKPKN